MSLRRLQATLSTLPNKVRARHLFVTLALVYALFAGFRTVTDPDLGWQVATGRWIVQHSAIPSVDVLSYPAAGHPWMYPFLSQVILWAVSAMGGYFLLTCLSTAACVGAIAVLLRGGERVTAILACIAVPIIADRTPARAELFTEILLAAFVSILWFYCRRGRGPIYLLPFLMVLWVNLHQGFIAGVAMCFAYVGLELEEALAPQRRPEVLGRLRTACPWLLATVAATLVNPWTYRNYLGMFNLLPVQSTIWIQELNSRPISADIIRESFSWRDPRSAGWWLIAAAAIAIFGSLLQRKLVPAIILAVAIYADFHSVRLIGPFAIVTVVIAGSVLEGSVKQLRSQEYWQKFVSRQPNAWGTAGVLGVVLVVCFTLVRVADLATDRYYMRESQQVGAFGPGVGRWMPDGATAFIREHHLPGNIFNDYTTGGFVSWKLSPTYPDYIDGRGDFAGIFFRGMELLQSSMDSVVWREEVSQRGINTAIVSLDHSYGAGVTSLSGFCKSEDWRPVYLDTKAAVFVRRTPETDRLIREFPIDCQQVHFNHPPATGWMFGRADRFHYFLSSAAILNGLGRTSEALTQLQQAEAMFEENRELHFMKGAALLALGSDSEGEKELRRCLEIGPYDAATLLLGSKLRDQNRLDESLAVVNRALRTSEHPHQLYLAQGVLNLDRGMLSDALASFDRAEATSPFKGPAVTLGAEFNQQLSDGREVAWSRLADYYEARGLRREAEHARAQAASFTSKDAVK